MGKNVVNVAQRSRREDQFHLRYLSNTARMSESVANSPRSSSAKPSSTSRRSSSFKRYGLLSDAAICSNTAAAYSCCSCESTFTFSIACSSTLIIFSSYQVQGEQSCLLRCQREILQVRRC